MTEEVKKIISVEVNGHTTVKELKEEISKLRDALLNVEEGSEEYKKIVEQLIEDEKKLTRAMSAGKKEVHAAAGSYNALSQEMSALKKVWKEVTDEATRNEIGNKINSINNQLKEMDASIGNHQRNVGNYEEALEGLGGKVDVLTKLFGNAVPALSKLSSGISSASSAAKAFGASLGVWGIVIAAVIIKIEQLKNRIEKFKKSVEEAINRSEEFQTKLQQVKSVGDTFNTWLDTVYDRFLNKLSPAIDWVNAKLDGFIERLSNSWLANSKIGKWLGLDQLGKINKTLEETAKATLKLEQDKRQYIIDEANAKVKIADYDKIIEDKTKSQAVRQKAIADKEKLELDIQKQLVDLKTREYNIIKDKNGLTKSGAADLQRETEAYKAMKEAEAGLLQLQTQNLKKSQEVGEQGKAKSKAQAALELKVEKTSYEERKTLVENEIKLIETKLDRIEKGSQEEIDLQTTKIAKQKKLDDLEVEHRAEAAKKTAEELYAETKDAKAYAESLKNIEQDKVDSLLIIQQRFENEYGKLFNDWLLERDRLEIQGQTNYVNKLKDSILHEPEDMMQFLEEYVKLQKLVLDRVYKQEDEALEDYEARYQEAYHNYIEALNNYWNYTSTLFMDSARDMRNQLDTPIRLTIEADDALAELNRIRETERELAEETITNQDELAERLVEIETEYIANSQRIMDDFKNWVYDKHNTDWLYGSDIFHIQKEALKDEYTAIETLQRQQGESENAFQRRRLEMLIEYNEKEKKLTQDKVSYYMNYANATSSIMNSVADAWEDNIQARVDAEEMGQEEAEKQFKWIKGFRIATTWIDTLGAMSQIMADPSIPTYWVKAALASSQLAQGIASTIQIKNTSIGSTNTSSGGNNNVSVTPILTDYQPQYMANATSQTETEYLANALSQTPIRAYVVEADISSAQALANNRKSETSF